MQMGVCQNQGHLFGGPHTKDYNLLDLYWGPFILGDYQMALVKGIRDVAPAYDVIPQDKYLSLKPSLCMFMPTFFQKR